LIDTQTLTALLAAGSTLLAGLAVIMMLRSLTSRTLDQRVTSLAGLRAGADTPPDLSALGSAQRLLRWIGETVRGRTRFYSEKDIVALEGVIVSAGFRPRNVLPVLLGIKVVLAIAVPAAAILYGQFAGSSGAHILIMTVFAIPVGLLGPDWLISAMRRPYLAAMRRGVPDALDLLVVCSEAGMGLESALAHVSHEMLHSNPAISVALGKLLDDMRILPDRREAFTNFAQRTGVEGARRVSGMLAQSIQYGTPLSQALRTVALDLRRDRMIALEAKTARLPALLTLPLILFIMPSLFIVLIGPAVMRLGDAFRLMHH
jgi:tight adherence protein C